MKPYISMIAAVLFSISGYAQTKKQTIASSIDKVTVFMKGAQVTRSATTSIPAGNTILVFQDVSPELEEKSIQVQGDGAFTILSVARETNFVKQQKKREDVTRLEEQEEALEEKLVRERNNLKVYMQEEVMLGKNQDIRSTQTGVKTADLREAMDFQRARLAEVLEKQAVTGKSIRKLEEEKAAISNQLEVLINASTHPTTDLLVTVFSKNVINGKFTLSYLVKNAGWYPTYDLRVASISQPMELVYKASVYQECGEEWKNVKLSLSTGNPTESGTRPELQPWNLRLFYSYQELAAIRTGLSSRPNEVSGIITDVQGHILPGATIKVKGRTIGTSADDQGRFSLQLPPGATSLEASYIGYEPQDVHVNGGNVAIRMQESSKALDEVVITGYGSAKKENFSTALQGRVAGVSFDSNSKKKSIGIEMAENYTPTTVTFDITNPYTIVSDGKPYTVSIKELEVPAQYQYYAAPKLDKAAFLVAGITNWESLNLLEGETSIYFEGTYVGKSLLDLQTAGDTLQVSLGRDKNIVINRTLQKDYSKRQFIGNYKTDTRNWELSVKNNKREPIRLILQDQLPISTLKDIELSKVDTGNAKEDEVTKLLTWELEVAPGKDAKRNLKYAVKYPKDRVINLD